MGIVGINKLFFVFQVINLRGKSWTRSSSSLRYLKPYRFLDYKYCTV